MKKKSLSPSRSLLFIILFFIVAPKCFSQSFETPEDPKPFVQITSSHDHEQFARQERPDSNSFFAIFAQMLFAQVKDSSFYAALIVGFMYTPAFAFSAYFISCFITTLIGLAFAEDLLSLLSSLVTGIVTSILYAMFSFVTMYFIYTMRDPQVAIETKPEEKTNLEGYSNIEEGEGSVPDNAILAERQRQRQRRGFFKKYFNFEFFSTQLKRFFVAVAMLVVSEMAGSILSDLLGLRDINSSGRVFFGALLAYIVGVFIIFGVGYLIKKYLLQKLLGINTDHVKMTKYLACIVLLLLGIVPLIITIKERQKE